MPALEREIAPERKGYLRDAGRTKTGRIVYELTDEGRHWASDEGFSVPPPGTQADEKFAVSCVDWTERRDHLAGALAVQLLRDLIDLGVLVPGTQRRSLLITANGADYLRARFGIVLPQPARKRA